jgi:hypothetical protein
LTTALLIVHALLAIALLGAITHQTVAVWWPVRKAAGSFVGRFRGVSTTSYSNAIVLLYVCTALLGSIIYPEYRLNVRVLLEQLEMPVANGIFELKEHFASVGLALLPVYWVMWHAPAAETRGPARAVLTAMLAFIVWWNFLVGHILNNIRGFGS